MNRPQETTGGRPRAAPAQAALELRRRLGRDVLELRRARGLTQRQLATRSGLQQAEISRVEAGRSNPTLSTLAALSHALDAVLSLSPRGREEPGSGGSLVRGPSKTRFLCLVCADTLLEQMPEAAAERHLAEYRAFTSALARRGQLLSCDRLLPADTATTVRVRKGKVSIVDGPFAETKEIVGGYFVIEARSRAEAARIASRIPGARLGSVEVRPIAEDAATLRALGRAAAGSRRAPARVEPRRRRSS